MSFLGKLTRRWQLGGGYRDHRDSALRLAQDEMDGGVPRQEICDLLLSRAPDGRSRRAYVEVAQQLRQVMLERNARATGLERGGDQQRAIELYEANVADRFLGDHPYERLLEIYSRRGDWRNAARVAEAYLQALDRLPEGSARRQAVESELSTWRRRLRGEAT